MSSISRVGKRGGLSNNVLSKIEDANGNIISFSSSGGSLVITDTVGRTITATSTTLSTTFTYLDSNGNQQTITLNNSPDTYKTGFPTSSGEANQTYSGYALTSIVLANGDEWTMQYDNGGSIGYGELTKITYPTGGYSTYQYTFAGVALGDPVSENSMRQVVGKQVCRNFSGSCSTLDSTVITPTPDMTGDVNHNTNLSSNVVDAVGDLTSFTFGAVLPAYESQRKIYSGTSTLLKTIATAQTCGGPSSQTVTLPNGLVSKKVFPGDAGPTTWYGYKMITGPGNGPFTSTGQEFGYGSLTTPVRQTMVTWLGTNPVNGKDYTALPIYASDRKTAVTVEDANSHIISNTTYEYDNYSSSAPHANLSASGATQHDTAYNASAGYTWRGNVTQTQRWSSSTSTWLSTTNQLDDAGNVLKTTDPLNIATAFSYADSWGNTTCTPTGGNGAAYVTSVTNALTQVTNHSYNSCTGTLDTTTDANSQVTKYRTSTGTAAYDALGRVTQVNYPDGGQTTTCYSDDAGSGCNSSQPQFSTTTSTLISSSLTKTSMSLLDGIGNVIRTELTSDPSGTDYVDTVYDGVGRKVTVSNPYRGTNDATYGVTTYQYDGLNRVKTMIPQDGTGSADNVQSVYDSAYNTENCNTVTDEAGKVRESCSDGLGRLVQVFEDPSNLNYETDYAYDLLDDLTGVTQKGNNATNARVRSFTYDSLARLNSATNPESGMISYSYDADGNLLTKTAPSPNQLSPGTKTVVTTYTYDTLNRLTSKSYVDGYTANPVTPTVLYGYDGANLTCPAGSGWIGSAATNGIGRRTVMCDGSGSASWKRDAMGRVLWLNEEFLNPVPPFNTNNVATSNGISILGGDTQYSYYLNGDQNNVFYPGNYFPDLDEFFTQENAAGQIITAGDSDHNVFESATYTPTGQLSTAFIGGFSSNPISNTYNNRLQPVLLSASTTGGSKIINLTYNFNLGTSDNGNVIQIANGKTSNRTENFTYDSLNRIKTAYTTGPNWGETYTIDAWGNLTNIGPYSGKTGGETLNCASANTSNQLNTCFTYDTAGNLVKNGTATYTYDAENRLIATGGDSYIYDGDGQRVEKCTAGTTPGTCSSTATGTFYWKFADGSTQAESDLGGNWTAAYGVINGKIFDRVDLPSNVVHYYFHDHLGTSNVITNASGTVLKESDYYPYGGEIVISGSDVNRYKFTGKERDGESGLDTFGGRYNSSGLARWMSPDPSNEGIDFYLPQSWNRYAYVLNNPEGMVDPNGLWPTWVHDDIIDQAFQGNLSKEQRQILKDSSASVDTDQSTAGAYKHGMSDGNDVNGSVNAMQQSADYIRQNEQEAETLQQQWVDSGQTGLSPRALQAFGNALHTITDETSPSHEGFQPWYGVKNPLEWPGDAWHFIREACPGNVCRGNHGRQQDAINRAQQAFWLVFKPDNASVTSTETDYINCQKYPEACK